MYDGEEDPDDHLNYFELMFRYRNAKNEDKCKIFPLTLSKAALAWYRDLKLNSISSWSHCTKLFSAHFTTSKVRSKS